MIQLRSTAQTIAAYICALNNPSPSAKAAIMKENSPRHVTDRLKRDWKVRQGIHQIAFIFTYMIENNMNKSYLQDRKLDDHEGRDCMKLLL